MYDKAKIDSSIQESVHSQEKPPPQDSVSCSRRIPYTATAVLASGSSTCPASSDTISFTNYKTIGSSTNQGDQVAVE